MKKILLFGPNGQVGFELKKTLAPLGHIITAEKQKVDFSIPQTIVKCIREVKPDIIVNAAAYTAVDQAESEKELANAINAIAPGVIAEEAKKIDALLVHYSTDYVFNGSSNTPYIESDLPDPINVYGKSKLSGEKAIEDVSGRHLILRTSWVYGLRGKNFLLTMLKLAKERKQLKIVGDQIGAPTWSRSIASATTQILQAPTLNDNLGLYHLTCSGKTSWHGFAEAIFKCAALTMPPEVIKITTQEYPLPAKRPAYSVLDNTKLKKTFCIEMPSWSQALQQCMNEFM